MSEYQYIAFRAIDAPVSQDNLAYMRQQSSRADITPWSFTNEYHFGDFHGDALGMLHRGYDFHMHYANYGVRSLYLRLPNGLPDREAATAYLDDESLRFVRDRRGGGGVLVITPYYEPGDLDELWECDALFERLVPLRHEVQGGDLRPLYLAHLAVSCDVEHDNQEAVEVPVPAGLDSLTAAQRALAEFYQIDEALIAAAAQAGGSQHHAADQPTQYAQWLSHQPQTAKDAWLLDLMVGSEQAVRGRVLAQFTKDRPRQPRPAMDHRRTIAQLRAAASDLRAKADRKAAAEAAPRARAKRLTDMAADPYPYLREAERLVARRSTRSYREVALLLADLRDALAGTSESDLAERQARKLKREHPTLNHLTAALRREGFIPK